VRAGRYECYYQVRYGRQGFSGDKDKGAGVLAMCVTDVLRKRAM